MAAAEGDGTSHGATTLIPEPAAPAGGSSPGAGVGDQTTGDTDAGARRVKWLDRIRATRAGRLTLKVVVGAVGLATMVFGFALVPLPGPGWVIVLAGLAILAIEFAWAKHLLRYTKARLQQWTRWMGRQPWVVRIAIGAVGTVFVGAVVWLSVRMSFGVDLVSHVWTVLVSASAPAG